MKPYNVRPRHAAANERYARNSAHAKECSRLMSRSPVLHDRQQYVRKGGERADPEILEEQMSEVHEDRKSGEELRCCRVAHVGAKRRHEADENEEHDDSPSASMVLQPSLERQNNPER